MKNERRAGILLPIFSLPSNYGIGTLGKEAFRFIDFLKEAKQSYWQILPIGPTSYGDSPYQSFSSYAGNPYFIDLDKLIEQGLLEKEDVADLKVENPSYVDYGYIYETRFDILRKAYLKGKVTLRKELESFVEENADWVKDYALFMALKKKYEMKSWLEWPDEEIRLRKPQALREAQEELKEDVEFYEFLQYLFFEQYAALKEYAHKNGIKIIGDVPIYVALDSADVWANPKEFQLDKENYPECVAGVPPDYFSEDGQLWGNPLYDWDAMKKNGYQFWIRRIGGAARYYDVIRIDHFRGFQQYWAVPYGAKTAKNGKWIDGPSLNFVKILRDWFSNIDFIAEDLGIISEDVTELLKASGFPGMKVLEFGMGPKEANNHTPHNHESNSVCYISTHDNSPIMGWKVTADPKEVRFARKYLGLNWKEGFHNGFIRGGMSSVSNLFVSQIQDYLGLGEESRINTPGTAVGNWQWRLSKNQLTEEMAAQIAEITERYGRAPKEK